VKRIAVTTILIITVAACSGDDDSGDASTPPLPTAPATSSPSSIEATTTSPASTDVDPTTTSLNPVPSITDPTITTTAPIQLPPVTTLVPEVASDLLTAEQLDAGNPNNSRPILPEHLPVIEAYLKAIQASTLVSSRWPIDPDDPELLGAPFTPETLTRVQRGNRDRLERGEVLDVSQGVTFRPYVVGAVGDTATVFDCEIAGHYWKRADNGELIAPDEIWPAGPGRIVELGLRVELVLRDGQWLWNTSQIDPAACA
jgi:hypothetical protein